MEKLVLLIGGVLKTISFSDIITVILSMLLILLVVYFIYLIRLEEEPKEVKVIKKEQTLEEDILEAGVKQKEEKTSDILARIIDDLNNNYQPKTISLTKYEEEQENTAIISYDELVKRANTSTSVSYDEEYENSFEDLVVKKVTDDSNTREYVNLPKAILMDYKSEEDFLKALRTLQENLVR